MKHILKIIIALALLLPVFVHGQVEVDQGGTGVTSIPASYFVIGSTSAVTTNTQAFTGTSTIRGNLNILGSIRVASTTFGGVWGAITGSLSAQADLQTALDNRLAIDGSNANTDITINGYSFFTGGGNVTAGQLNSPYLYIGSSYNSSPIGLLDGTTGNFDISAYGSSPFVGWNSVSSTPYFGSDPTVNGYGINYGSSILYITANGGSSVQGLQLDGAGVINGDSSSYVTPLTVNDSNSADDGNSRSFTVYHTGLGREGLSVLNNGSVYMNDAATYFDNNGGGYLAGGITWNNTAQLRVGGGTPIYAYLEAIGSAYSHIRMGQNDSIYSQMTVDGAGGLTIRPSTNNTGVLKVANSAGTALFTVDSSNDRIIGRLGSNDILFAKGASDITPNISIGASGGKAVALVAGTGGTAFTYDSTGTFSIGTDTRANIVGGSTAGGTARLTMSSAGNVSIGMASNATGILLGVNGKIGGGTFTGTYLDVSGGTASLLGNSGVIVQAGSNSLSFNGASSVTYANMTSTNGMFRFGTVTPTHSTWYLNPTWTNVTPTTIVTASSSDTTKPAGFMFLHNDSTTAGAYTPMIVFSQRETDASHTSATAAIGSRSVTGSGSSSSYNDGELMFYTSPTLGTPQGLTERMRITQDGKVGIGTTTPVTRLSVIGTTTSNGFIADFGTATDPSYSFLGDSNTGFYNNIASGGDNISVASAGNRVFNFNNSFNTTYRPLVGATTKTFYLRSDAGAVGTPNYSFDNDADTGMWSSGANTLNFTTGGVDAITISSTGAASFNNVVRLKGYTVATLPAGTQGDTAYVTDALAPTYLTAVVGGGAIVTPVFYNGTAWVAN